MGEAHSKNGNIPAAKKHFEDMKKIAQDERGQHKAQADAHLKLGLLNYQQGFVTQSVQELNRHFYLAKDSTEEARDQSLIDAARVNLGIAKAHQSMELFKGLVLQDLHGLLDWKISGRLAKK